MSQKMEMMDMPSPQAASVAFDTHRFVKNLMGHGFTEKQAEGLAEEQVSLLNSNLVTNERLAETEASLKADLAETEVCLKADLAKTEASLKADLAKTEARLKADLAKTEVRSEANLAKTEASLKADLAKTEARLEVKIAETAARSEVKIAETESRLVKWMFGMTIGMVSMFGTLFVMLIRLSV